jgi:hypothetical protein
MRILEAAWQCVALELTPLEVVGCIAIRRTIRDDFEMHFLSFCVRRACWLLRVRQRLLCAVANGADRLGWLGFTSNRHRDQTETEADFQTSNRSRDRPPKWDVGAGGPQTPIARPMGGGPSRRSGRGRKAKTTNEDLQQLLGTAWPLLLPGVRNVCLGDAARDGLMRELRNPVNLIRSG